MVHWAAAVVLFFRLSLSLNPFLVSTKLVSTWMVGSLSSLPAKVWDKSVTVAIKIQVLYNWTLPVTLFLYLSVYNRTTKLINALTNSIIIRMLIVVVALVFSGMWCYNVCCKISTLKGFYYFSKCLEFFQSLMSVLWAFMQFFSFKKNSGNQEITYLLYELMTNGVHSWKLFLLLQSFGKKTWCSSQRSCEEGCVFTPRVYILVHSLLSSGFWLCYCHLVFEVKLLFFFLFQWGFTGLFKVWLVIMLFNSFNLLLPACVSCLLICFLFYFSEQRAFSLNETPREKR